MTDIREIVANVRFARMAATDPRNPLYSEHIRAFEYAHQVRREIDEELQAIEQAGYAIVPVEPTEAMMEAYLGATDGLPRSYRDYARNIYKAMLTAAKEGK